MELAARRGVRRSRAWWRPASANPSRPRSRRGDSSCSRASAHSSRAAHLAPTLPRDRRTKSSRGGRSPGRPCWRSLSVGERLSARFRLGGRPVGRCVSGPSPSCAIVVICSGALSDDPGHSRGQEGGGSTELFAAVSFGRSRSGAPLDRRLFSVEDANSPRALLGPRGAFTEPRRPSDALVVTRRHARPASVPTDALSASCVGLRLMHER